MLFVNRSDNREKRSTAQHQRGSSVSITSLALGAGYAAGAMLAAIDRSARRLPAAAARSWRQCLFRRRPSRPPADQADTQKLHADHTDHHHDDGYLFIRCPAGRKMMRIRTASAPHAAPVAPKLLTRVRLARRAELRLCRRGARCRQEGRRLPACSLLFVEYDCAPQHQ